jgi:hypothetical protein
MTEFRFETHAERVHSKLALMRRQQRLLELEKLKQEGCFYRPLRAPRSVGRYDQSKRVRTVARY